MGWKNRVAKQTEKKKRKNIRTIAYTLRKKKFVRAFYEKFCLTARRVCAATTENMQSTTTYYNDDDGDAANIIM
jgi:hypothetical protein